MFLRTAMIAAALLTAVPVTAVPASASELKAEEARRFVVGKVFSYTCFEGTNGAGRIYADGSVAGTVQLAGSGPVRHVRLPAGTLKVKGESVCASMKGMLMEPCFSVVQTSSASFKGSLSGLSFASCTFVQQRRNPRLQLARGNAEPLPLPSAVAKSKE